MRPTTIAASLAVLAAALAGCVGQAPASEAPGASEPITTTTSTDGGTAPSASATGATGAVAGTSAGPPPAALRPFALHLQPDLSLAEAPPAQAARVTLTTPLNSPFTTGYPVWEGTLPAAVELGAEGVAVTFYVTTNSASFAADNVIVFDDLPGFFVTLGVGDLMAGAQVDGPAVMVAGEVHEVTAVLTGDTGPVAAGEPVRLYIDVIYSHVTTAAEFQYALGPEHPARLGFNGAP